MHEMGHAIHSQQGAPAHEGKNIGGAGMGIGESQSRFYENYVGRSRAFWQRHFYKLQTIFPVQLAGFDPDSFYRMANRSKPGLIRLDADELTYSSHIMVRYELEREIMSGDYDINKLPDMWNDKIESYLVFDPKPTPKAFCKIPLGQWLLWLFPHLCPRHRLRSTILLRTL
jgi:carboxypeptidase Taq